jgi:hypothetical protein
MWLFLLCPPILLRRVYAHVSERHGFGPPALLSSTCLAGYGYWEWWVAQKPHGRLKTPLVDPLGHWLLGLSQGS